MDRFGCTSPFGHYLDNICMNNSVGKQAFELFEKLSDERNFITECSYPCKFLKARFLLNLKKFHKNVLKFPPNRLDLINEQISYFYSTIESNCSESDVLSEISKYFSNLEIYRFYKNLVFKAISKLSESKRREKNFQYGFSSVHQSHRGLLFLH